MIFQYNATHRVSFDKNLTSLALESTNQPSRNSLIHLIHPSPSVILKQEEPYTLLDFQLPICLELLNEFRNKQFCGSTHYTTFDWLSKIDLVL